MKTTTYILKPDNTVDVHTSKVKDKTLNILNKTYQIDNSSIFTRIKHFRIKQYIFLSEARINAIRTVENKNYNPAQKEVDSEITNIKFNSNQSDYDYQILLHSNAIKNILEKEDFPLMLFIMATALTFALGFIVAFSVLRVI